MNAFLKQFDELYFSVGRALLGTYFLIPGIMKIVDYAATLGLMVSRGVPFAQALLPLTIVLQIGLGIMVVMGKNTRISALILFALIILINLFIHNFWAMQGQPGYGHELQNFVKNLAIAAGFLVLAGRGNADYGSNKTNSS
jgi:putative oxidoreductase